MIPFLLFVIHDNCLLLWNYNCVWWFPCLIWILFVSFTHGCDVSNHQMSELTHLLCFRIFHHCGHQKISWIDTIHGKWAQELPFLWIHLWWNITSIRCTIANIGSHWGGSMLYSKCYSDLIFPKHIRDKESHFIGKMIVNPMLWHCNSPTDQMIDLYQLFC